MRRRLVIGLGLLFVVGACGGGDGGGESAGTPDTTANTNAKPAPTVPAKTTPASLNVCEFLTADEVTGFLGQAMTSKELHTSSGSYGDCEWTPPGGSGYTARVTVGPARLYEILKSKTATPLAGLGDEAWSLPAGNSLGIGAKKGDYHIYSDFSGFNDLEKGKQMLQRILAAVGA